MSNPVHTLSSPAKLNLFLEVKGCRQDGFHELETVMVRTSLCDQIQASCRSDQRITFTVVGEPALVADVPTDESNLVQKAAAAFQAATGLSSGWNLQLTKVIPMEAGLAGGSSNAATTLRLLNQLAGKPLQTEQLHTLAASLGSDVNFFVEDCQAAVCTGRGERVASFALKSTFYFVVGRPARGNSTPAVFAQLGKDFEANQAARQQTSFETSDVVVAALKAGDFQQLQLVMLNRLQQPACQLNPEMAELLDRMAQICERPAMMSGSGSTCFVCCEDEADAVSVLEKVKSLNPDFCMIVQTS